MSVEFIGGIAAHDGGEIRPAPAEAIDPAFVRAIANAHESAGFDRALIGTFSTGPDGAQIAAHIFAHTHRLKLLLAHRPGFVAPTVAARQLATLDAFSGGRLAVHIVSGGNDEDLRKDGETLDHGARYARTDEYLDIVKRSWTSVVPFDHDGPHYRLRGAHSAVGSVQEPHPPLYFGGSSDRAIEVAARHANVYAMFGEPLDGVREIVAKVRRAAHAAGRTDGIGFSLSLRPILADTEEAAWARARRILEIARARIADIARFDTKGRPEAVGAQRLLQAAAQGRVLDKRLWTEFAALMWGQGNMTALVGTAEQVAESLLDYHDAGITTFLIRGFDPIPDALDYGRALIPLVREAVAARPPASREARA